MNMLTRKLIAKDFYLNRWLIIGSTVAGLAGLLIAAEGKVRFNIGMLIWLTTIVAFGVVLAMFAIANERKERALQFVLSLPLSHGDYVRIKVVGLLLCFLVPWLMLSAGAVALIAVMPNLPDGLLPFAVLLCGFLLANYSVVLVRRAAHRLRGRDDRRDHRHQHEHHAVHLHGRRASVAPRPLQRAGARVELDFLDRAGRRSSRRSLVTLSLPYFVAARRRDFI